MNSKYIETWYVKINSNSEPKKVILFFKSRFFANAAHNKAIKENDARILFGSDFPKEIASCWQ